MSEERLWEEYDTTNVAIRRAELAEARASELEAAIRRHIAAREGESGERPDITIAALYRIVKPATPSVSTSKDEPHCETCICGRRAPVQGSREHGKGPGSVGWAEHLEAWSVYASRYGRDQSAERVAERGGFCFGELYQFLGHAPKTWSPR